MRVCSVLTCGRDRSFGRIGPLRGLRSGLSGVPARGPFPPSCEEAYIGKSTLHPSYTQSHAVKRRTVLEALPNLLEGFKKQGGERSACAPISLTRFGTLAAC